MIVATFPKLTRTELANTICELFSWKRPTGKLKTVECRQFLERVRVKLVEIRVHIVNKNGYVHCSLWRMNQAEKSRPTKRCRV